MKVTILVLLIFFSKLAVAQLEFSCTIKDELSGKPILGAKVEILNRDTSNTINVSSSAPVAISNKDGQVSFQNILPGKYVLSIVHSEHEAKKLSLPPLTKSMAITINLTPLPALVEKNAGNPVSVFRRIITFFKRTFFGK
jgi:hypothetical protein